MKMNARYARPLFLLILLSFFGMTLTEDAWVAAQVEAQVDLSGTYSAQFCIPTTKERGRGVLTISGNRFTINMKSGSFYEGRIAAVQNRSDISVALKFANSDDILNLRATRDRKGRLWMRPVNKNYTC